MQVVRHSDDRAVSLDAGEHLLDARVGAGRLELLDGQRAALRVWVDDRHELRVGVGRERRQVRLGGPPAAADDRDPRAHGSSRKMRFAFSVKSARCSSAEKSAISSA